MIKEIKYNGYSANPSDYECADGDLATSIGVIPENGALKPILPPSEVLQFKGGDSVMYIHKSANFKHYIITILSVGGMVLTHISLFFFVHLTRYIR